MPHHAYAISTIRQNIAFRFFVYWSVLSRIKASMHIRWILVCLIALTPSQLEAGTIKKIDRKKKLVLIDEGKGTGVTKTSKICFKDAEGVDAGCGKVSKIKASSTTVKVTAKVLKKLKKGFEVVITADETVEGEEAAPPEEGSEMAPPEEGVGTTTPAEGDAAASSAKAKGKKGSKTAKGKKDKATPAEGGKWRNNIKLAYILTPKGASTFNRLSYQAPSKDDSGTVQATDSLWSTIGAVSQSLLGFGLEAEFGIGATMSMAVGFKQKKYSEFKVESDYDVKDGSHYTETSETSSAQGFWFDFYYLEVPISQSFIFRLGNGIDYESSQVDAKITHKYDGPKPETPGNQEFEVASASSKLSTISLRTVLNTHFFLDPIGLNFALNVLVPLTASEKFSGTVGDPNAAKLNGAAEDDLKAALGHKKAAVGVEALFGLYFAF